jgi:dihydrofolate reductase
VKLAIIAAVARNRGIGLAGKMPWHLSEDLRRFKRITTGHTILMGRKTWESLGRPLPQRRNVVLSRTPLSGVETYASIEVALAALSQEEWVFVIGGGEIYRQTLPLAGRLYLTIVDQVVEADTYFPEYASLLESRFTLVAREDHEGYRFEDYVRDEEKEKGKRKKEEGSE